MVKRVKHEQVEVSVEEKHEPTRNPQWSKLERGDGVWYVCEICARRAEPGELTGDKPFRTQSTRQMCDHLLTYKHRPRTKPLYGDFISTPPAEPDVIDAEACGPLITAAVEEMRVSVRSINWAGERLSDIGEHTRWQRVRLAEAIEQAMARWLAEEGLGPPVPDADADD